MRRGRRAEKQTEAAAGAGTHRHWECVYKRQDTHTPRGRGVKFPPRGRISKGISRNPGQGQASGSGNINIMTPPSTCSRRSRASAPSWRTRSSTIAARVTLPRIRMLRRAFAAWATDGKVKALKSSMSFQLRCRGIVRSRWLYGTCACALANSDPSLCRSRSKTAKEP